MFNWHLLHTIGKYPMSVGHQLGKKSNQVHRPRDNMSLVKKKGLVVSDLRVFTASA